MGTPRTRAARKHWPRTKWGRAGEITESVEGEGGGERGQQAGGRWRLEQPHRMTQHDDSSFSLASDNKLMRVAFSNTSSTPSPVNASSSM